MVCMVRLNYVHMPPFFGTMTVTFLASIVKAVVVVVSIGRACCTYMYVVTLTNMLKAAICMYVAMETIPKPRPYPLHVYWPEP
jgi:hypothetical protein